MNSWTYRTDAAPTAQAGVGTDRPLWIVHGGPQADPLRRLLFSAADAPYTVASTPSADSVSDEEVRYLRRLVAQADALITEPLPAGYLGKPVGVDDLVPLLRPGTPVITFPRVHFEGLHPYQVGVTPGGTATPPIVPYHDLRTIAAVSGHTDREKAWGGGASARSLRECAAWSLVRMRLTEASTDIRVADGVRSAGASAVHTVDRPGNALLTQIARDVQGALGVSVGVPESKLDLLGQCRVPVSAEVAEALGFAAPATNTWSVYGKELTIEEVDEKQTRWYHDHPGILRTLLAHQHARMDLLGVL